MPEQLISASGTQFGLIINSDGSLNANITGSIMIGSVSAQVDSIYVQSGTMYLSSGNVTMVSSAGSVGVYGSVYTTGSIVTAGSTSLYGTGSVRIAEQGLPLQVYNSGLFSIVGSITSMPTQSITTGSEVWIKAGSVQTYSPLGSVGVYGSVYTIGSINQGTDPWRVTGSITNYGIGSVLLVSSAGSQSVMGSVYSTGSMNIATDVATIGSFTTMVIGSSWITNPTAVGSYTSMALGSSHITNWLGSTNVYGSVYALGSVNITSIPSFIGSVNVTNFAETGSVNIQTVGSSSQTLIFDSGTTIGLGALRVSVVPAPYSGGNIFVIGSVNQNTNPWITLGSVAITNIGSVIQSTSPWIVLGSVAQTNIGSVIQSTSPWVVSGTSTVSGSVYATGSVRIGNSADFEDFTLRYTTTIAYTGLSIGSVVEYMGLAAPGTSKTTAFTWQIRRNTYASDGNLTDIGFADGNTNFDNSWADRGTGAYT